MLAVLSAALATGTGALAQPHSGYDQRQAPAYDQGQRDQQRPAYDQRQGDNVRQDQRSRVAQTTYSRHRHRVCYVRHHHRVCSWRG
jgi:hypothetical protein